MVSPERLQLQFEQLEDMVKEQSRLFLLDLEPSDQERTDLLLLLSNVKNGIERLAQDKQIKTVIDSYNSLLPELDELDIDTSQYRLAHEPSPVLKDADQSAEESPSSSLRKSVRFSDTNEEYEPERYTDHPENSQSSIQIYGDNEQQLLDQDLRLGELANSVRNQHHIGTQIDSELTDHLSILGDVESQTNRSQSRLDTARHRVDYFNKKAREGGSCVIIMSLVLILFILLILL